MTQAPVMHNCFHCGTENRTDTCIRCGLWQSKKDEYKTNDIKTHRAKRKWRAYPIFMGAWIVFSSILIIARLIEMALK